MAVSVDEPDNSLRRERNLLMQKFSFHIPTKTYFGVGSVERVGEEARKLGIRSFW